MNEFRTAIETKQEWNNKELHFDPDSSPKAWEHYKKYYTDNCWSEYSINKPEFFSYVLDGKVPGIKYGKRNFQNDEWYNYVDSNVAENNRLFAITMPNDFIEDKANECKFFSARYKLGGDTDFNFNEKHSPHFELLLCKESNPENQKECLFMLGKCVKMHHTLLNFSLMQSMGDIQGFKGKFCEDRLDKFLFFLNRYYETDKKDRESTSIARNSTFSNRCWLVEFLNGFDGIYDYCKKVYFISEDDFVDKLIKNGKEPITCVANVVSYMNLAITFWEKKENHFISINKKTSACSVCGNQSSE